MGIVCYENGDLLKKFRGKELDGIAHGCNCFHAMASGIAAQIRIEHIEVYRSDIYTNFGDQTKLGDFSVAETEYGIIYNLYTQYRPGKQENLEELYLNIERAFAKLNSNAKGMKVGIPKIGAGIAGGDWERIKDIIESQTPDLNIVVVNFVPDHVNMFDIVVP